MFYEIAIKVTKADERGKEKEVVERFITDVMLFAEAEQKGLELYNGQCDVVGIRRSNVYEIVNEVHEEDDKLFKAKIVSVFVDDSGREKPTFYHVIIYSKDINNAQQIAKQYMSQGLSDMTLVEIKQTNLVGLI